VSPSDFPETRELSAAEKARYSRHLILHEVGLEGQRTLKNSSVLCVGAGGLGSPLLMYLAAAGVGRIGVVDFDKVEVSNLQRQVVHNTSSVGKSKVQSASERIAEINPHVKVDAIESSISSANALRILKPYDVIVDGTDNFPTRYLINDACVILGKPNIYGSIFKFEGQASVFNYQNGPNYRDLFPDPPPPGLVPSCAEGGVLGVLPGVIGAIQATETIKVLLQHEGTLSGRLLLYNALDMSFREMQLRKDPNQQPITTLIDYDQFCGSPAQDTDKNQMDDIKSQSFQRIDASEANNRRQNGWKPFILDVRRPPEAEIVRFAWADLLHPHDDVSSVASKLPRDRDILVHCKLGHRSAMACQTLANLGFSPERLFNLEGGIIQWATTVDPSMPVY